MWLATFLMACNGDDPTTTPTTPGTTEPEPVEVDDVFVQTINSQIDVLWVVDPGWSDGMDALEGALDNGYELLLLTDIEWRFGVLDPTRTGSDFGIIESKYETYPPPESAFSLGTTSDPPRVREAIYTALELRAEQEGNLDFLRNDANLYVIVFTNAEDESDPEVIKKLEFEAWFEALQPSNAKHYNALTDADQRTYWEGQAFQGIVFGAGSFRKGVETLLLDAMGQRITFELTQIPAEPPTVVHVIVREQPSEYIVGEDVTYDPNANTITFDDYIPPPAAQILVSYLPATDTTASTTGETSSTMR